MISTYNTYKEKVLKGRYITISEIEILIDKLKIEKAIIGYSFLNKPIYKLKLGKGKTRVLIWSQMHGNESTGTKAIFDLINFVTNKSNNSQLKKDILSKATITIIPMLNPDGAALYTRVNAQQIDLNRDAVDLKASESKLLNKVLHEFKPDYCFNLHDQRSFFSVKPFNLPATLSFLAPSEDETRAVTDGRIKTMKIIVAINKVLQKYIPNQIGRYTDEFYPTATGDNFQKLGFNTILIESGHYPDDYLREETRKYTYFALLIGIDNIVNAQEIDYKDYFKIPNNEKKYFNKVLTNVILEDKKVIIGVFSQDKLVKNKIIYKDNFIILKINSEFKTNNIIDNKLVFREKYELIQYINNKI